MSVRKPTIQVTKDYRLFKRSDENRPLDMSKHRNLEAQMKRYGFLPTFPAVCFRDKKGNLIVKDGQHRLAIAETLGLPVYWVEASEDFDIADINSTARTWTINDYVQRFAAAGIKDYADAIAFAGSYKLPVNTACGLLAGHSTSSNVADDIKNGTFKVVDLAYATMVAGTYAELIRMCPEIKHAKLLQACVAVARVEDFDAKRLISGATRCREKLVSYSTREGFLDMLEDIYNFGRSRLVPLKMQAMIVMKERNATTAAQIAKAKKNDN